MKRESLVFYRSFADAIRELEEKDQLEALWAVINYGLDGVEPEGKGAHKAIYTMAKPQIDANNKRYQNGSKGGKQKSTSEPNNKHNVTKPKPNTNQSTSTTEPNDNVNVNDNVNEKKNIMCEANDLFERLWKKYPCKKGKGQVSDAQKKRLLAVGEPALVKAIERYSSELQKDADWRKPQNGSTFFNSGYVDYLDGNFTPSSATGSKNGFKNFKERTYDYDELQKELLLRSLEE